MLTKRLLTRWFVQFLCFLSKIVNHVHEVIVQLHWILDKRRKYIKPYSIRCDQQARVNEDLIWINCTVFCFCTCTCSVFCIFCSCLFFAMSVFFCVSASHLFHEIKTIPIVVKHLYFINTY